MGRSAGRAACWSVLLTALAPGCSLDDAAPQQSYCEQYLQCLADQKPELYDLEAAKYGEGGLCFLQAEDGQDCERRCELRQKPAHGQRRLLHDAR